MATALTFRLLDETSVSKGLAIVFGGASLGGMLAAPMGSYLGDILGWQSVFLINGAFALIATLWLLVSMPSLQPEGNPSLFILWNLLKNNKIKWGLIVIFTAFCGRFTSITYLRPFLENELALDIKYISLVFLLFDIFYFLGTFIVSKALGRYYRMMLYLPQLILAVIILSFIAFGHEISLLMVLISLLGLFFSNIPLVWSSWGAKIIPDQKETIGGLYVASTQLSAAFAGLMGGILQDYYGSFSIFVFSGALWLLSSALSFFFVKRDFE